MEGGVSFPSILGGREGREGGVSFPDLMLGGREGSRSQTSC